MALAERSREDIRRFEANTKTYNIAVTAGNEVSLLDVPSLKIMIEAASKIDLKDVATGPS